MWFILLLFYYLFLFTLIMLTTKSIAKPSRNRGSTTGIHNFQSTFLARREIVQYRYLCYEKFTLASLIVHNFGCDVQG